MYPSPLHHLPALLRITLPWLAAALALPLHATTPTNLTIGTGALNGVYYPTGGAICRLLNEDASKGLHCSVQSTSGSLSNLKELGQGKIQLALVQSDVVHHAAKGTGPFVGQPPNDRLRSLFRLHQESLTLLASATSSITTLADIEGKRVDLGNPGSGERVTSQALLDAMGWQASSFAPVIPAAVNSRLEGLCDGTLDAAFVVAGHPNQGIGDLTGRCKARIIPIEGEQIDRLLKHHPYYQHSRIGANLYPGQPTSVSTFAVTAELIALDSLPEAEVRTVRDVLTARLKQFTRLHPALTPLTQDSMLAATDVPRHPGMEDAALPLPSLTPESLTASATEVSAATPAMEAASAAHASSEVTVPPAGTSAPVATQPVAVPPTSAAMATQPGVAAPPSAATQATVTMPASAAVSPAAVAPPAASDTKGGSPSAAGATNDASQSLPAAPSASIPTQ
ncbi:TAXI family TRAP transporter solute-binding subunit [Aeromonas salmonicida]|uniref:TAXI family TRAP transporter solute-binding subunit n=1 Tax=Aeromonas salmonicida TaxID=645 RepID=UPI00223FC9B2|nr:TAXI family TRAP transporter solute-binding subunit [Aeromonas salmonicida]MDF8327726.1 TAXI family TRAP transporter solute-binding subunit [Aeromonas salmonicida]